MGVEGNRGFSVSSVDTYTPTNPTPARSCEAHGALAKNSSVRGGARHRHILAIDDRDAIPALQVSALAPTPPEGSRSLKSL